MRQATVQEKRNEDDQQNKNSESSVNSNNTRDNSLTKSQESKLSNLAYSKILEQRKAEEKNFEESRRDSISSHPEVRQVMADSRIIDRTLTSNVRITLL